MAYARTSFEFPLELRKISKRFGDLVALEDLSLILSRGSVHALVGGNGAGKSTTVKVIAGVYPPDGGEYLLHGERRVFRSAAEARDAGIAVIHQDPVLFPDLTAAENVVMGRHPLGRWRRIDRAAMRRTAVELFARLGADLDPDRPADSLSIAERQIVEIARAISQDAQVLVMDEPTASLSGVEASKLFEIVSTLREDGRSVLLVSHHFDEIFEHCDTITVIRDGRRVVTELVRDIDVDTVIRMTVGGRPLYPKLPPLDDGWQPPAWGRRELLYPQQQPEREELLRVEGLGSTGRFADISFSLHAGEIVGLAGLVGSGRSEVARAVFGVDRYEQGSVRVSGVPLRKGSSRRALRAGIAMVPEDRHGQGLVLGRSTAENLTATIARWLARFGVLSAAAEFRATEIWGSRLGLRPGRLDHDVETLSGGNQQRVVLAKWLAVRPRVLIVDEPTRGIDMATKPEVHRLLADLAGQGMAILLISSDLPELIGMSGRILVLRDGRIVAETTGEAATTESLMEQAGRAAAVASSSAALAGSVAGSRGAGA